MAKITYKDALGDLGSLRFNYVPDQMFTDMDKSGNEKAVYFDDFTGASMVMKGRNFAYLDGELLKGKVESIVFKDEDSNTTATIDGLDLKAKTMHGLATADGDQNLYEFLKKAFSGDHDFTGTKNEDFAWADGGNDVIKALGGADSINGMGGNDVMTGGGGSDHFFFLHEGKGGKDVITDFDANGAGNDQDYIAANFDDVLSIKQVGDDVVIDFGFGDTLTLLDTHKKDINVLDFDIPA